MALTGPLELVGALGTKKIYNSTAIINLGFTSANAVDTGETGTLWVAYTVNNWDHGHPDDRPTEHIVSANTGSVDVSPANILSAQGFNVSNPGIIMFEHSQYRGYAQLFQSAVPDLTQYFSPGSISGVSSVIIVGGIWALYTDKNYKGVLLGGTELGPGMHDFGYLPIDDLAMSAKCIRAS